MHFVLQARECSGVAVGVELVIKLEDHAQRVFGVGKGLEMPGGFTEEASPLADLEPQIGDVAEVRDVRREFQHFTGAKGTGCLTSGWRAWCTPRLSERSSASFPNS